MNTRFCTLLFLLCLYSPAYASDNLICQNWHSWPKAVCQRLHQLISEGESEIYMTGYAWHNRWMYSADRINSHGYNELAWGGGFGKRLEDAKGYEHNLFAFAFLDSHKNIEPVIGYGFLKTAHLNENTRLGFGLAAGITARPDIYHNIPFPGVLPWLSIRYRKATVGMTYIPGSHNVGNVLFVITKWAI